MASRFKLDENLRRHAHALLVSEGHEAHTVNDEQLEGCPDDRILDACKNEDRILVTLDLDFADIPVSLAPRSNQSVRSLQQAG